MSMNVCVVHYLCIVHLQETLKEFILRKERGELTVQKEGVLRHNIMKPVR